jgi:ribosomal protein S18 acetylase RimI-like enzyme
MIVLDWHAVPAGDMARLYAIETGRWSRDLSWDTSTSWAAVELARTTWGLPGVVCVDLSGRIRGWAFYLVAGGRFDVGGLTADSPEATGALVDELIARAGSSHRLGGLIYAASPDVLALLAARGVPHLRYAYRFRRLDSRRSPLHASSEKMLCRPGRGLRAWSEADLDVTGELLHEAYDGTASPIGVDTTVDGWRTYVTNLVRHRACGTLSPAMSRVLTINRTVAGVALVSAISPHTAHLVQLAVGRAHQGTGIGRALLSTVVGTAREAGHTALSLLVAHGNAPAMRLYQQAGFADRGTFVALGVERAAPAAAQTA